MAKLFYTLQEAAAKLKKSEAEIKAMVASGQLQEFRDRDRLMFKVDQVNLMVSGGEDEGGGIPLAESGEMRAISLSSDSGSGLGLETPKEQTGISIFEAEATESADPSAVTHVTETAPPELALETVGSGSGLLDLTREADDTSLGQNLLEGSGVAAAAETAADTSPGDSAESPAAGLFETTGAEEATSAPVGQIAIMAEDYDGPWSGLAGGFAVGMLLVVALTLMLTVYGLSQSTSNPLVTQIAGNIWMWVGIAAGVVIVPGIIGMLIGRKT